MIAIRHILFPSDLSCAADHAFGHARLLAERFGASVTLFHAVESPTVPHPRPVESQEEDSWRQTQTIARAALEQLAKTLTVSHRIVVERKPSAHRAVVDVIRHLRPDLTVMATHGRSGLSHLLLGSVAEKVVQQVDSPVLCVRQSEKAAARPYRRILIPTDLSLASRLAFPVGALLARTFRSEILAIHVVPSAPAAILTGVYAVTIPTEATLRQLCVPTEAALWKFFQPDFKGIVVRAEVLSGSVWDRIVDAARIEGADLIVMSTHGHDSLGDSIVGSNTERVVRHAPCPVLIVGAGLSAVVSDAPGRSRGDGGAPSGRGPSA
jgi:nucleotide-binding universal stress UspA family protein